MRYCEGAPQKKEEIVDGYTPGTGSGPQEVGPEKPFNPEGDTIFERTSHPSPPGQYPVERREGNQGGVERRG